MSSRKFRRRTGYSPRNRVTPDADDLSPAVRKKILQVANSGCEPPLSTATNQDPLVRALCASNLYRRKKHLTKVERQVLGLLRRDSHSFVREVARRGGHFI